MADTNLDEIDLKILQRLQDDGRITNVELANSVGLTAPPCLRRMRALEDEGVINSYHAAIDPAKMGYTITVFAMVSLKSQAETDLQAFEEHVQKLPEVRECYMLNGEIDFILKVVAKDLQQFQSFLTSQLTAAPNVASVKTSLTIRSAKHLPGVPIQE
ncbi:MULTISPECIES: Lrp/AsnC family transcriptional regulator [Sphingomonadaceae]|jgi:DNA-binding Lrp family transcriptional regulator|nr:MULTISPECIES: Lrp/AsnC family transcriptional regulator [Sphingomonadaceae]NCN84826.1 Lrp/AsnC family transcriptional regulator [Sphingomonadales bacterium]PIX67716.1 MAG: Lrp/AsnC family transcriptional regulator [Sphingomonadales bacterium CG_4_10_14_3_um_filter_58_15]AMO71581.1 ArsR family transcriptional regulator [Sphingorhabdus sp. M41]NCO48002.1 Lrp/AsnC family transcriptional regulator [Sphingomonadales bacterium]NCO98872.1 Lrp/AsnC family transcriptional regulator [Sphingomonadales|tara:strand:+ start:161 stop:634 length:474 start_codon:yes stop_codon:yes gene_type:complete